MSFSLERNKDPYYGEYTQGGAAYLKGESRKAPFQDQQSPGAKAWFQGYDDAQIGGPERLPEIEKIKKWFNE